MPNPRKTVLALALPCALMATAHAASDLPVHTLDNGSVRATVTDAIGGRLLSFALAGKPNGLQLVKRYALVPGKPHSLRLDVDAANVRKTQVAWDIWFNTRAHGATRVYVPVARRDDVRQQAIEPKPDMKPLTWTLKDGIFT